jgi:Tfp pilus assembly protein PilO
MKRNAIIGVIAGAIVIVLLWYVAVYKPKSDEISKVKDETATAERQQQDLEATLARLRELDDNAPQQQARLDVLNSAIPADPDLADFIFQANEAAAQSGVDWISVAPTPPVPGAAGGPSVISLSLQVQGGFFQVLDYLNRLEDLDRLVVIGSINVVSGSDAGAAGTGTTPSTLSTATSGDGAPTLTVTLDGQMYTRTTAVPTAPGAPATGDTTTTTVPATGTTTPAATTGTG